MQDARGKRLARLWRRLEFSFWVLFLNAEDRRALAALMRATLAESGRC